MFLKSLVAICGIFISATAQAQTNVFFQAISFAVTGSETSKIKPIDRSDCVFSVGQDIIHFNNIHLDRLEVKPWEEKWPDGKVTNYITVDLRGEGTVYEEFKSGLARTPNTEQIVRELQKTDPTASDIFNSHMVKQSEHKLKLYTNEYDRVVRAWSYIYHNGCAGKKSPF